MGCANSSPTPSPPDNRKAPATSGSTKKQQNKKSNNNASGSKKQNSSKNGSVKSKDDSKEHETHSSEMVGVVCNQGETDSERKSSTDVGVSSPAMSHTTSEMRFGGNPTAPPLIHVSEPEQREDHPQLASAPQPGTMPIHLTIDDDDSGPRRESAVITLAKFQSERKDYIQDKTKKKELPPAVGGPYSASAVMHHNSENDLWIVINGKIYDATSFVDSHPGGVWILVNQGGKDCTEEFKKFHSQSAWSKLEEFYVADLESEGGSNSNKGNSSNGGGLYQVKDSGMSVAEYKPFRILKRIELTKDTVRIVIALPQGSPQLVVPPGGHVVVQNAAGENKPYTPIETTTDSFTLVVKRYPNGKLSSYLWDCKEGESVCVRGPIPSRFSDSSHDLTRVTSLVLLGAGTGVVPLITIARSFDLRSVKLVFVVWDKTSEDALCQHEMDELRYEGDVRLVRHFTRSGTKEDSHVSEAMLRSLRILPTTGCVCVVCGPTGFNKAAMDALVCVGFSKQVITVLE